MTKKAIIGYVICGVLIAVSVVGSFVSVRSITSAMSADAIEQQSKSQMAAAIKISHTKDRVNHLMSALSAGKEIKVILQTDSAEYPIVVEPNDESKQALQDLIRNNPSIKDIIVEDLDEAPNASATPAPNGSFTKNDKQVSVYHIKKGDTLSEISDKVSHSVDELAKYNKIDDVNLIYAGSALRIPDTEK